MIFKVEECKETFKKDCFIEYHTVPKAEKVEICQEPLVRDCDEEGEQTCSTEYETVCETVYHENEVVPAMKCPTAISTLFH